MGDCERSCAERIAGELEAREEHLAQLYRFVDEEAFWSDVAELGDEDPQEVLDSFGLGVSARVLVRVEISTGGPADWVEAECELVEGWRLNQSERTNRIAHVEPVRMTYHYSDWFDHAETPVGEGSALWRWVAGICECGVEL